MLRNRDPEQSDAVALYPKNLQEILNSITQAAK
jgi:hypothetical protein